MSMHTSSTFSVLPQPTPSYYLFPLQVVINPDGTFTVDVADTPAGSQPFESVEVTFEVPTGGVTVEDLTTTACVHPGKYQLIPH